MINIILKLIIILCVSYYIIWTKSFTKSSKKINNVEKNNYELLHENLDLNNTLTILPHGGLCNHLRVIFSYYEYAKSINSELNVIWLKTKACPGYFLDYFEKVPNINIILSNINITKIHYKGSQIHPKFPPNYKYLKILPHIKEIITNRIKILKYNYIAVHIRRTDYIQLAQKYNKYISDKEFIHFIDKYKNNKNIYIATDNKNTYNKFKKKYVDKIKFEYPKTNNNLRETSMLDAIIDIYMCIHSDKFMGSSKLSSFSALISDLRKIHNK